MWKTTENTFKGVGTINALLLDYEAPDGSSGKIQLENLNVKVTFISSEGNQNITLTVYEPYSVINLPATTAGEDMVNEVKEDGETYTELFGTKSTGLTEDELVSILLSREISSEELANTYWNDLKLFDWTSDSIAKRNIIEFKQTFSTTIISSEVSSRFSSD